MPDIIDIPDAVKITQLSMQPVRPANITNTRGRFSQVEAETFPYWTADYSVAELERQNHGEYLAFMMQVIAGSGFAFKAFPADRPRPLKMNTGEALTGNKALGGAFDGTCDIGAITNSTSVNISGLPSGFILVAGDYVEFRMTNETRSLHVITSPVTSNASGEATIEFQHPLDIQTFTTSATVNFEKPSCIMQVFEGFDTTSRPVIGTGSFVAQEVFL